MPTLTIYLPDDLYQKVREKPSKIIQKALREYFKWKGPLGIVRNT